MQLQWGYTSLLVGIQSLTLSPCPTTMKDEWLRTTHQRFAHAPISPSCRMCEHTCPVNMQHRWKYRKQTTYRLWQYRRQSATDILRWSTKKVSRSALCDLSGSSEKHPLGVAAKDSKIYSLVNTCLFFSLKERDDLSSSCGKSKQCKRKKFLLVGLEQVSN